MKQQTTTAFLVQLKSTGLFWKSDIHWDRYNPSNWTADLTKAFHFKNTGGAKASRGWHKCNAVLCSAGYLCAVCKSSGRFIGCGASRTFKIVNEKDRNTAVVPVKVTTKLVKQD